MAFPSFLRWLFASSAEAEAESPIRRLVKGKNTLNAVVRLKHLCYYENLSNDFTPTSMQTTGGKDKPLWRFAMDSPQQSESPHKPCKTCPRILPATTEYFHRDKYSKDGLCSSCKECKKSARRAYYAHNRDQAIAYSKKYVQDHREHTAKYQKNYAEQHQAELTAYKEAHYAEHQEEQIARNRQYYAEHKQQVSDYGKRRRLENPEKKREQNKRYRETHSIEKRARDKQYKEDHRAERMQQSRKYYEEHREKILVYAKLYIQTERGIIAKRVGSHNRRARKKKAPGSHTTDQLYQQFMRQDGKCFYCQVQLQHARNSWNADHVIPLSRGGSNGIENIVIACPTCNRRKNDKLPHEWLNGGEI